MTLKMGSRTPKTLHILTLSQGYSHSSDEYPSIFKKYLILAIKSTFVSWQLKWGQGHQSIVNSLDCPLDISVVVWFESRQGCKRYNIFSEIFTY